MATLSGNKIKNTYQSLVKFSDNGNITVGAKQLTDGFGNNSPMFVSTTQIGIGVTPETGLNLHVFGDAKIGSNLTVIGNLVVEGSTTTVGTDTLTVKDPLIVLANNNTSTDAVDIGFYGKYTPSGTTLYSGLFREALTGKYRLFKGLEVEPTTTVNTSGTGYAKADLVIGALEATTGTFSGNIILSGTVDGRDVATDGAKLDGIEAGATTDQTAAEIKTAYESNSNTNAFTDADETKLNGIEASADVTDATNVLAAGAVMTSGNQSISGVKTFSDQVTIPATPSASTDAASKGYVDSAIGDNNELSEVLANGNTTGGTDIAVSAGDDITFADDSKAIFGTDGDLEIYHYSITDQAQITINGELDIRANTLSLKSYVGETMLRASSNGTVRLYYDGVEKLQTTSYGVNVTGAINADDYISIEGATNPYLRIQDTTNEEYLNLYSSDNESAIVYSQDTFKISSGVDFLNQTPRLTIDSSGNATFAGNIGVGVTPESWGTSGDTKVIRISTMSSVSEAFTGLQLASNFYFDGNNDKYILSDFASSLLQIDGEFRFRNASSGTAGNNIGWNERMRIDSSGNVGIGTDSPTAKLMLEHNNDGAVGGTIRIKDRDSQQVADQLTGAIEFESQDATIPTSGVSTAIKAFSASSTGGSYLTISTTDISTSTLDERMRIDSSGITTFSGDVSISNTSGATLNINTNQAGQDSKILLHEGTTASPQNGASIRYDGNTNLFKIGVGTNVDTTRLTIARDTGNATFAGDVKIAEATNKGQLFFGTANTDYEIKGGGNYGYLSLNAPILRFDTGGTERMRIRASGTVGINAEGFDSQMLTIAAGNLDGAIYATSTDANCFASFRDGNSTANIEYGAIGNAHVFRKDATEYMRIDSSGNVGIGTTSPDEKLDVENGNIRLKSNSDGNTGIFRMYDASGTESGQIYPAAGDLKIYSPNDILFTQTGNVGIGTTSPTTKLQVAGIVQVVDGGNTAFYSGNYVRMFSTQSYGFRNSAGSSLALISVAGDSYFNGGNVGIGTTSPSGKLNVFGATGLPATSGTTFTGTMRLQVAGYGTTLDFGAEGPSTGKQWIQATDASNLAITYPLLLNPNGGNVGIGTTSPATNLDIGLGTLSNNGYGGIRIADDSAHFWMLILKDAVGNRRLSLYHGQGSIPLVLQEGGGNVGIGLTSPQSKLHIGETATVGSNFTTAVNNSQLFVHNVGANTNSNVIFAGGDTGATGGTGAYSFGQNGLGYTHWIFYHKPISTNQSSVGSISSTSTATAYNTSSDYRLKENVVEMTGALDRVNQLRPSRFNFIADADTTVDGFLAHEVQDIVPEAITGEKDAVDEDGNAIYQGIDQSKLVPLLVGAIKELKAEIELLKTQINN